MADGTEEKSIWCWVAWTEDRERIADCGYCVAVDAKGARDVALMCLRGPHARDVRSIKVEHVAQGRLVVGSPEAPRAMMTFAV